MHACIHYIVCIVYAYACKSVQSTMHAYTVTKMFAATARCSTDSSIILLLLCEHSRFDLV
jgi:hypothetical protein